MTMLTVYIGICVIMMCVINQQHYILHIQSHSCIIHVYLSIVARCQVLCVLEQRKEENDVKIIGGWWGIHESVRQSAGFCEYLGELGLPPFRVGRHIVFPRVSVRLSVCLSQNVPAL